MPHRVDCNSTIHGAVSVSFLELEHQSPVARQERTNGLLVWLSALKLYYAIAFVVVAHACASEEHASSAKQATNRVQSTHIQRSK